jgi:predicted nucleic acid-binding protein
LTRFVVDCDTLLGIAAGEIEVADSHQLVAPTLVRSQALAALYDAAELGWETTYDAGYVALTKLHADASVTSDAELVRRVSGLVTTATAEGLRAS